jgi:hypothetical protein
MTDELRVTGVLTATYGTDADRRAAPPAVSSPRPALETAEQIIEREPSLAHVTLAMVLGAAREGHWRVLVRPDGAVVHPARDVVKYFSHTAPKFWDKWPELRGR